MVEIIGVRFKQVGKIYYFSPKGIKFDAGDHAIVETVRGVECGEVVIANRNVDESEIVPPLKEIIRKSTAEDMKIVEKIMLRKRKPLTFVLKIAYRQLNYASYRMLSALLTTIRFFLFYCGKQSGLP